MRRGLLQGLEQRILCICVRFLEAQEQGHAVFGLVWLERKGMGNLTDLFHLEFGRTSSHLHNLEIGMLHFFDLPAIPANTAEFARGWWIGAIHCLSEVQCQRAPANAGWPAKQVGVARLPVGYMSAQQADSPFVPCHVPVLNHHGKVYQASPERKRR